MKETQEKYLTEKLFLETIGTLESNIMAKVDSRLIKVENSIMAKVEATMDLRFAAMKSYVKEGFDIVFEQFERIGQKIDAMDQKIEDLAMTKVDKEEFLPLYKRVVKLEKKAA